MGDGEEWAYDLGLDDQRGYNRRRTMRTARTTRTANESEETMSDTATRTRTARTSRRGFGGYNKTVNSLNQTTFRVEDDSEVIAFLEDENFFYALRHWVKYIDSEGKPATRAEWCLSLEGDEEEGSVAQCPLCDIGDRPKPVAFFNVVDLASPGKVLVWEASSDPTKAIEKEFNKLAKKGQLLSDPRYYWVVSREKGKNGFYSYTVDRLDAEDLGDQWNGLKPLTDAQRIALGSRLNDESYVELKTREEIQEFVDTLG